MTVVHAVKHMQILHELGIFQGGMCVEQILLWVRKDFEGSVSRHMDMTYTRAIFLDWSSSCRMTKDRPVDHSKPFYKGLGASAHTKEQLISMDLDAAMFTFNHYTRQALALADAYLVRYEHHPRSDRKNWNLAFDYLGNEICPTRDTLEQFKRLICVVYQQSHLKVSESSKHSEIVAARAPFLKEMASLWTMKL